MKSIRYPSKTGSHLVTILSMAPFTPKSTSKLRSALHFRYSIVNEIGDKFHYLFICPAFQEDRNRLLKEYYRKLPIMYKFIELISKTNMKDLRKLAEFATIIIRKFQ